MSYHDLKTAISLKSEEKLIDTMQMFESLVLVVSQALSTDGGSKSAGGEPPKTVDELEARLARTLG